LLLIAADVEIAQTVVFDSYSGINDKDHNVSNDDNHIMTIDHVLAIVLFQ
jgi:co-chaperonin GroES (HSP10)